MESNISDGSCGEFHLSYYGCIPTNPDRYKSLIRSSTRDLVKEIIKQTAIRRRNYTFRAQKRIAKHSIRTRRHVVEAVDDGINNDIVYNSLVVELIEENGNRWPPVDLENPLAREPPNESVQEENEGGEEDPSESSIKSATPPRHTPPEMIIIHSDEED
ncbi:hypothetical protein ACFX2G_002219 [Malus domestica]